LNELLISGGRRACGRESGFATTASSSMKAFPGAGLFMPDLDDGVVGVAMDVDVDGDALELLGDAAADHKPSDADFFNDFEDDFDDTDMA
jgi:hypothetical protein